MKDVTATDIKMALAKKHGNREFFITECKNGPTGRGMLQFDGLAIYKSWAHPKIVAYEIKVSRSDFLRDNKYTLYMPYVHEMYFVVPKGLVDRSELPVEIGLMYYNPENESLITRQKATHRKIEICSDMLLYIIMNRLDSERLPFTSNKGEYFRMWLDGKLSNRDLGYRVSSKMLRELEEKDRELARYGRFKEDRKILDDLLKVMEAHGIGRWGNCAENLDKALKRSYPAELETVELQLQGALREIAKIKLKEGG